MYFRIKYLYHKIIIGKDNILVKYNFKLKKEKSDISWIW